MRFAKPLVKSLLLQMDCSWKKVPTSEAVKMGVENRLIGVQD
jgi:hypothetical protein